MGTVLRFPNQSERSALRPVAAPTRKGTSPNKGHAATGRTREYLTQAEIDVLLEQAKKSGRTSDRHRNYTIILLGYRHGMRVGELCDLRWMDIDLEEGTILIRRKKGSSDSTHYLQGDEIRALCKLQREKPTSPYVFLGRGRPLKASAIASMFKRLGSSCLSFPVHIHMLRHACGHALAMKGMDTRSLQHYLGHKNIRHTERYTALSPVRFKGIWDLV